MVRDGETLRLWLRTPTGRARRRRPHRRHQARPVTTGSPRRLGQDDFIVDHEANTVTCPAGVTVTFGHSLKAHFGSRCTGCLLQDRCTTSPKGRTLSLNLYGVELEAARRRAETEEFQQIYGRWRPMVERTIAWLVTGANRRLRYRDAARYHQGLLTRTAALNLRRLINLGLDHPGTVTVRLGHCS